LPFRKGKKGKHKKEEEEKGGLEKGQCFAKGGDQKYLFGRLQAPTLTAKRRRCGGKARVERSGDRAREKVDEVRSFGRDASRKKRSRRGRVLLRKRKRYREEVFIAKGVSTKGGSGNPAGERGEKGICTT